MAGRPGTLGIVKHSGRRREAGKVGHSWFLVSNHRCTPLSMGLGAGNMKKFFPSSDRDLRGWHDLLRSLPLPMPATQAAETSLSPKVINRYLGSVFVSNLDILPVV